MNEPANESQPTTTSINTVTTTAMTNTNQTTPALAGMCRVCGRGCAAGDTLCADCGDRLHGWLRGYLEWIGALREFLDSTAHYGGHQPGRVNLASAPTPVRLSVLDHLQEIEGMAVALWRRLYAPSAMPWVDGRLHPTVLECLRVCADCPRLRRLPDIELIWHDWESLTRRTLGIIDVPPAKHGIGRCLNPLCGVGLSAEVGAVSVACPMCGNTYRVMDVRLGFLKECISSGRAFTAGECAELLRECGFQCSVSTIYSWRKRGRIQPAGKNGKGQPLYRLSDVHDRLAGHDVI